MTELARDLDAIDCELLRRLQADGRIRNKELAAAVGLAPSSCLERVRRLRDDGVLTGTVAQVAPLRIGVGLQAMVALRLSSHARDSWQRLREVLLECREVVSVFHLSGADDLLVHVACRDTAHLRQLVIEQLGTEPAVRQVETSLVFEHLQRPMPIYETTDPNT